MLVKAQLVSRCLACLYIRIYSLFIVHEVLTEYQTDRPVKLIKTLNKAVFT